jgi:hypothetical protein
VLCYFFAESHPFDPPSNAVRQRSTAQLRFITNERRHFDDGGDDGDGDPTLEIAPLAPLPDLSQTQRIVLQCRKLLRDQHYWRLTLGYGLGPFEVILFLVQVVRSANLSTGGCELDTNRALLTTLVGAVVGGIVSIVFQAMRRSAFALKISSVATLVLVLVVILLPTGQHGAAATEIFGAGGFIVVSSLSLYASRIFDSTYPVSEVISFGIFISIAYLAIGVPSAIVFAYAWSESSACLAAGITANLILVALVSISTVFALAYNGLAKRTRFENQRGGSEEEPLLGMQISRNDGIV